MARVSHTVLTALPSAPDQITLAKLIKVTGLAGQQVRNAIDRLSKRGLAIHTGLARYQRSKAGDTFIGAGAVLKPGPTGGKQPLRCDHVAGRDTLRDRAWGALRQMRKATLPELIELAGKGDEVDPVTNLRTYLWRLVKFEIVGKLKRRVPGLAPTSNGFVQFVLLNDLGPKAPIWRSSTRHMIDRNSDTIIAPPAVTP